MSYSKFLKDPLNFFLLLFFLFFVGLPVLDARQIPFSLMPFFYLIVILLGLFISRLASKFFFQCVLFLMLAFFADLILMITTSILLERIILISTYSVYITLSLICLGFFIKRMFSPLEQGSSLVKLGASAYLLIGFLWSLFYGFIFVFDKRAFSYLMIDQFPFLQFSFSTLTALKHADLVARSPVAINIASAQVICGQLFLAVLIARITSFYTAQQLHKH